MRRYTSFEGASVLGFLSYLLVIGIVARFVARLLMPGPDLMSNHLDRANRLGRALGPTLVQLPPRWRCNVERLDEFLAVAPRSMRWAVELRDASWLRDDVYEVLHKHRAAL